MHKNKRRKTHRLWEEVSHSQPNYHVWYNVFTRLIIQHWHNIWVWSTSQIFPSLTEKWQCSHMGSKWCRRLSFDFYTIMTQYVEKITTVHNTVPHSALWIVALLCTLLHENLMWKPGYSLTDTRKCLLANWGNIWQFTWHWLPYWLTDWVHWLDYKTSPSDLPRDRGLADL